MKRAACVIVCCSRRYKPSGTRTTHACTPASATTPSHCSFVSAQQNTDLGLQFPLQLDHADLVVLQTNLKDSIISSVSVAKMAHTSCACARTARLAVLLRLL